MDNKVQKESKKKWQLNDDLIRDVVSRNRDRQYEMLKDYNFRDHIK